LLVEGDESKMNKTRRVNLSFEATPVRDHRRTKRGGNPVFLTYLIDMAQKRSGTAEQRRKWFKSQFQNPESKIHNRISSICDL